MGLFYLIAIHIERFGMRLYLKTVPKERKARGFDRLIEDIDAKDN